MLENNIYIEEHINRPSERTHGKDKHMKNQDMRIAEWIIDNDVMFLAMVEEIGLKNTMKALEVLL